MEKLVKCPAFALVIIVSLLLTACAGPDSRIEESSSSSTQPSGPITVVDAQGRTVEFEDLPKRIAVAGRATIMVINTMYLFPKAHDAVIAVTSGKQKPGRFLSHVDPAFDEKAVLEPEAGPEQIAPLDPDLVIMRSMMADKLGNALQELGIKVLYVDPETPEQFFRDLEIMGQILGSQARAQEITDYYQARLADLETLSDINLASKPSVLVIQHSSQGGEVAFQMPSASWIQTVETEIAAGNPIWKEAAQGGGWTIVNFEQIAAWNPDMIFVVDYQGNSSQIVSNLKTNPQWQELAAVKNDQIFGFAGDIFSWDQSDPRWILGVTWMASRIHPEEFPNLDVKETAASFFQEMYGMQESAARDYILSTLSGDVE